MSTVERPTPGGRGAGSIPRRTPRRQARAGPADTPVPTREGRDAEAHKRYWAGGAGPRLHPASRAVVALLDADVAELLQWLGRDLDPSAELDDAVQTLALAQLEAQATAPAPTGAALVRAVDRRARRDTWQVRSTRGRAHRVPWRPERMQQLVGPEADPAVTEDLGWDDVVRLLGWQDGLALWLWAVEGWSLSEIGAWQATTKQQVWHHLQRALVALRAQLAPRRAG
jgi:DNA-directed RNA polymerase specialized sigma24 family protein